MNNSGLANTAARGAVAMSIGQGCRIVFQMVSVVWLARLLSPEDFGTVAMVTAIIGVGAVIRDFGLGQSAVQAKALSTDEKSNLFWINIVIGLVISVLILFSAPVIAGVYGEPDLVPVVMALATTFLLNGISTQFRAQLSRDLRFKAIAMTEVGAQMLGIIVAVSMAYALSSYWAIVLQQIVEAMALLIFSASVARWKPGKYSRKTSIKRFVTYGWQLTFTQIVVYLSQNLDSFLIGRYNGAVTLGLYNRAFQLLMLPVNQIGAPATKVALPVLSRVQDDRKKFDKFLTSANLAVGSVVIYALSWMFLQAEEVVGVILGKEWVASAHFFRILAVAGIFQVLNYAFFWVFLSLALTRQNMLFTLFTRISICLAMILVAPYGASRIALAYAVGIALIWPVGLWCLRKVAPTKSLLIQGMLLITSAVGSTLVTKFILLNFDFKNDLIEILVSGVLYAAIVGLQWVTIPVARRKMYSIVKVIRAR